MRDIPGRKNTLEGLKVKISQNIRNQCEGRKEGWREEVSRAVESRGEIGTVRRNNIKTEPLKSLFIPRIVEFRVRKYTGMPAGGGVGRRNGESVFNGDRVSV